MASRERAIVNNLNERARFYGQTDMLTIEDVRAVLKFYHHTCLNCTRKPATSIDHVKPLANGGENKIENCQLLCVECNKVKGDSEIDYRDGKICSVEGLPENTQRTGKRGGLRSTSWKPGQSGNPKGAPRKGLSWRELILQVGDDVNDEGVTRKEAVVIAAFEHAENGNISYLVALLKQSEPVPEMLDVSVDDKRPTTPEERRARILELLERGRTDRTTLVA